MVTYDIEPYRSNFSECDAVIRVPLSAGFRGFINMVNGLTGDEDILTKLQQHACSYAQKVFAPRKVVDEFINILSWISFR